MSHLLPDDFVMQEQSYTNDITVEDILSHRTGLPSHDNSYLGVRAAYPDDARSITRNLRNLSLAVPIRTTFMYCNMMYTVATRLIEVKSGLQFPDYLEEHFFSKLNMSSTNLQPSRARSKGCGNRIATGYAWHDEDGAYQTVDILDSPEGQGAGSIVTSVDDYILYIKAILQRAHPFTESVYDGLTRSRTLVDPSHMHPKPFTSPLVCAAGWETFYYRRNQVVRYDGLIDGYGSTHFFLPAHDFGGVIFGNSEGMETVAEVLSNTIIDELLDVPHLERPDWNELSKQGDAAEDNAADEQLKTVRQALCPGIVVVQPQTLPLESYTGTYNNAGYHDLTVEIRDGRLFVDATDRSMGFTLTFDHVCDNAKYVAHLSDFQTGGDDPLAADFKLENARAVSLGLHLEPDLIQYIWFDRK
ncbi:beta-lactamase/transpeptidase-like protein [Hortaea werneckii]|nr:beta-lactamase/transpeptidase-like protein [Hortaea werneckii]KAI7512187.1 beta-lactamase/transpeptidase-like protein [Hortaea werneckii]